MFFLVIFFEECSNILKYRINNCELKRVYLLSEFGILYIILWLMIILKEIIRKIFFFVEFIINNMYIYVKEIKSFNKLNKFIYLFIYINMFKYI